jgi:hypothetical protein
MTVFKISTTADTLTRMLHEGGQAMLQISRRFNQILFKYPGIARLQRESRRSHTDKRE